MKIEAIKAGPIKHNISPLKSFLTNKKTLCPNQNDIMPEHTLCLIYSFVKQG